MKPTHSVREHYDKTAKSAQTIRTITNVVAVTFSALKFVRSSPHHFSESSLRLIPSGNDIVTS